MIARLACAAVAAATVFCLNDAHAVVYTTIGGSSVDVPGGARAFADAVVATDPGSPFSQGPTFQDPNAILGEPDWTGGANQGGTQEGSYSVGTLGSITVRFDDNALIGSGDDADDLFVFEIGSVVDPFTIEISVDGVTFFAVDGGQPITGQPTSVDIDPLIAAESLDPLTRFRFVRLTGTDANDATPNPGPDFDAVATLALGSTDIPPVPLPASAALLAAALAGLGFMRRRRA